MKVYSTSTKTQEMEFAYVSIGLHKDEQGEPLLVADGKVLGTPADVKRFIKRYERGVRKRGRARLKEAAAANAIDFDARVRSIIRERGTKWR